MLPESYIQGIIRQNYETHGPAKLQFSSFNSLVTTDLQRIIDEEPEITVEVNKNITYSVKYSDVTVDNPYIIESDRSIRQITPNEARVGLGFPSIDGEDGIRVPQNITGSATDATQGGRPPQESENSNEEETADER